MANAPIPSFGDRFVALRFGPGSSTRMGEILQEKGHKKVLVVYDMGIKNAGISDPVLDSIHAVGIETVIFDQVSGEPTASMVNAAGEFALKAGVDGIVAIGGGSCMDTAKSINVLLKNPGPIKRYFVPTPEPSVPGVPLYTIATTAGTGAEVTPISILIDEESGLKTTVVGPATTPTIAIVDPAVMTGLPAKVTASTGADALAHAIEAVTCIRENPLTDVLGYDAISRIAKWLPIACKEPQNMEARTEMAYAATFAGIAFINTGCHLGHAIGHNVGAVWHIPHGVACAVALPEATRWLVGPKPEKVRKVIEALGVEIPEGADIGELARKAVRDLLNKVDIGGLKSIGIPEKDLDRLADLANTDMVRNSIPGDMDREQMLQILKDAYI